MYFALNYNNGYVVCVVMFNERGYITTQPLRNFGDRQGDAKFFKLFDCPRLSLPVIKSLVKNYDNSIKYKRINDRHYVRQDL